MHNTFNTYLWNCTIDVSDFTSSEEHFIKLREPNIAEFKAIVSIQKLLNDDKAPDYEEKVIDVIDDSISKLIDQINKIRPEKNISDKKDDDSENWGGRIEIINLTKY